MQRAVPILAILLVGQLALAVWLNAGTGDPQPSQSRPLAQFDSEAIDTVRITMGDGTSLDIERVDGSWQLPAADGFPAKPSKVEQLLGQMNGLGGGLPVAHSEAARERYRLANQQFERRITLMAGDETVADVFFGESAGTGRVYARAQGRERIYEAQFPMWQTTAQASRWYDQSVLAVKSADVRRIELADFSLRRGDGGDRWQVDSGDTREAASSDQASQLVQDLARPEIEGVAKAEPPQREPDQGYTVVTANGSEIRFDYFDSDDGSVHLYRSDQPWRYEVAQQQIARIDNSTPDKLLAGQAASSESSDGGAQSGSS